MEFKATFAATESRTFTISFVGMPTVRALLRSVSSIHKQNMFSKSLSFVADKLLKLVESPIIELAVELFASSLLNSDLAQAFKSKYSIFRVYNLLGYTVVNISHKPSFLTGHSLKLAFGRAGAFGLQLFTKMGITSTPILDLLGVEKSVIRADCNINYPAIYPKNIERSDFKILSVMQWHKERCLESSFGAGDCRQTMDHVHGNNSLIISHRREQLSFWKRFAFDCFESFASAISSSLHQGRRQFWNALTGRLVGRIVVINLVPRLVLESPFCGEGECFGVSSHRIEKRPAILVSQPKLECYRPKHCHICI